MFTLCIEFRLMHINESSIWWSRFQNIMNSVLSELKNNVFLMDYIFKRFNTTLHLCDSVSVLLSLIATVVSSANRVKLDRSNKDGTSFINTRNNSGTVLLPWETPIVMFFSVEFIPSKEKYCFLSVS